MDNLQNLEDKVFTLLCQYAKDETSIPKAKLIAQKSILMNHLYEDLGFKNRKEMNSFMKEYFPTLAAKKPADKLWKKFIYDEIGETAPACYECKDQMGCFKCTLV